MGTLWTIVRQPLGFNIDQTYRIDMAEKTIESDNYIFPENKTTTTGEDLLVAMERIRQNPDIESVSISIASQPYAATHYGNQVVYRRLFSTDTVGLTAQEYWVTPDFFNVFKIHSAQQNNRNLSESLNTQSIILTKDTEELLMEGESSIGKSVQIGKDGYFYQVGAVCQPVRWTEYMKSRPSFYTLLAESDIVTTINPDNLGDVELCVRVKPDKDIHFIDRFMSDMTKQLLIGNLYLTDIRPTSIIRRAVVAPAEGEIRTHSILLLFLLVNIFLGVSGTFWFRTQQRRGEMGLRMSVGSTRLGLYQLLVLEGLAILTISIIPAILINLNIGLAELVNLDWLDFTVLRFLAGITATYLIMAGFIFSGIWYPAYRTTKIKPAEALHYE